MALCDYPRADGFGTIGVTFNVVFDADNTTTPAAAPLEFALYNDSDAGTKWFSVGYDGTTTTVTIPSLSDTYLVYSASGVLSGDAGFTVDAANDRINITQAVAGTGGFRVVNGTNVVRLGLGAAGRGQLRTTNGVDLDLGTNGTSRWRIGATTGHLLGITDNTYDIGASGATRPRNVYIGSGAIIGAPGWTLDPNDLAVGSSTTSQMHWDDSNSNLVLGTVTVFTDRAMMLERSWAHTSGTRYGYYYRIDTAPLSNGTGVVIGTLAEARATTAFNTNVLEGFRFLTTTTAGFSAGTLSNVRQATFSFNHAGAGLITNAHEILMLAPTVSGGAIDSYTQIELRDPGAIATNIYGVRQIGTNAHNRLNGATTIGADATPTATYALDIQGTTLFAGSMVPETTNLYDIGTTALAARAVYTRIVRPDTGQVLALSTVASTTGPNITITAADSVGSGDAGSVLITGGDSASTGAGGDITLTGGAGEGAGAGRDGGDVILHAGGQVAGASSSQIGRVILRTGVRSGGAALDPYIAFETGTTSLTERWRIDSSGHFLPQSTTYNIGDATNAVNLLYASEVRPETGSTLVLSEDGGTAAITIGTSGQVNVGATTAAGAANAFAAGTSTIYAHFDPTTSGTWLLEGNDAGALGPILRTYHNSASPAISDVVARWLADGEDSAGGTQSYGKIDVVTTNVTSTTEAAYVAIFGSESGALSETARFTGGGIVDFRRSMDGAGSNPATLINAPGSVAGAQAGWLQVQINGTTSYIPVWQ